MSLLNVVGTVSLAFALLPRPAAGGLDAAAATTHEASDDSKENRDKAKGGKKATGAPKEGASADCRIEGPSAALRDLPEASGLAASRRSPGILWSHLDSGASPVLIALDTHGAVKGKVRLSGVTLTDWEDVAVSPCGASSCVYVADIGDNRGARQSIAVHRLREPLPTDSSAPAAETFMGVFPDGPQDAEAFFVLGTGDMFVVTKGDTGGPVALYRFPSNAKAGGAASTLQKVGVLQSGRISKENWVTGASASTDGRWVVLRTPGSLTFYDAGRIAKGDFGSPLKFSVAAMKEPQGEGVAFGANGAVFLAGEGGGKKAAGTFGSLVCNLPASAAPSSPR